MIEDFFILLIIKTLSNHKSLVRSIFISGGKKMDLHDFDDVAENYDLYLEEILKRRDLS